LSSLTSLVTFTLVIVYTFFLYRFIKKYDKVRDKNNGTYEALLDTYYDYGTAVMEVVILQKKF